MGRNEKTKLFKHQKTAIACKLFSDMFFCPATVVPTKKPSSTRPKTQMTRRKCFKECSNKVGRKYLDHIPSCRRVSKIQRTGHKPLLDQSMIKQFMELRHVRESDMSKTKLPDAIARLFRGSPLQLRWAQNPSLYFNREIRKYTDALARVWGAGGRLRLPSSWSVFQNVDWNPDGSLRRMSTDPLVERIDAVSHASSSDSCSNSSHASSVDWIQKFSSPGTGYPSSNPSHASSERETMDFEYSELGSSGRTTHLSRRDTQPRARGQWSLLASLSSYPLAWEPQLDDYSIEDDNSHHGVFPDFNQQARNHDIWSQISFSALLSHWTATEPYDPLSTVGEVALSQILGRLLANVVATEMFPAYFEPTMRWPSSLEKNHKPPVVTYTCRATSQYLGWHEDMCPVLFAAQFSPSEAFRRPGLDLAIWKLDQAFGPTIALLTLYYLDTRTSPSDPLPSWMVLFGLVYTESSVHIRGHCPHLRTDSQGARNGIETPTWTTTSWDVRSYKEILLLAPEFRELLLCALNDIQGHCKSVLEHLKAWEGYGRACQLLGI